MPNPNSTALAACDENSATRVLAVVVFSQLECHYFDETLSHVDVARQFKCNVSQLSKALTGIDYASGPHHYKPKAKKQTTKRTSTSDPHPKPAKKTSDVRKKSEAETTPKSPAVPVKKTSDVREKSEAETTPKSPAVQEDTLSSSSSSEELPMGLL